MKTSLTVARTFLYAKTHYDAPTHNRQRSPLTWIHSFGSPYSTLLFPMQGVSYLLLQQYSAKHCIDGKLTGLLENTRGTLLH